MTNAAQTPTNRLARTAAALLAGAALVALAACSDEVDATTSIVQPSASENSAAGIEVAQAANTGTASEPASAATLTPSAQAPEPNGSVEVSALMSGQPLPDIVIGDEDAPVTIIEYASMTCGHCAAFHENSYPAIKANYVDTGKAKLILREFPFDPRSLAAFMLARCAGESDQTRRTAMIDVLFDQQDSWARAENASQALLQIARMAGMGQEQFVACLNDTDLQESIVAEQQRGQEQFGVTATPTFFVNGQRYAGAMSPEDMAAVIESALD